MPNNIAAIVLGASGSVGLALVRELVRDEHFDRAKAILDATPLSEEELTYLATGVLGEGPGTS